MPDKFGIILETMNLAKLEESVIIYAFAIDKTFFKKTLHYNMDSVILINDYSIRFTEDDSYVDWNTIGIHVSDAVDMSKETITTCWNSDVWVKKTGADSYIELVKVFAEFVQRYID